MRPRTGPETAISIESLIILPVYFAAIFQSWPWLRR